MTGASLQDAGALDFLMRTESFTNPLSRPLSPLRRSLAHGDVLGAPRRELAQTGRGVVLPKEVQRLLLALRRGQIRCLVTDEAHVDSLVHT